MRGPKITERDILVVLDVYKFRYLATYQVENLHFPSKQTANRRLRVLIEDGYIKGYNAPWIADRIFHLTPKGAEMVASALGIPTEQLPFRRISDAAKDYYFLRHFLQLNDFRIALQFAQKRQASISLLGFIPEYFGDNSSKGGVGKYIKDVVCDIKNPKVEIQFTPDAVFALEKSGTPVLFFLEIDRGTEVVGNPEKGVLKAINFYYNYFISKKYNRYAKDFKCGQFNGFRVLFVTTTETRLGNMRAAVKQANHKETRFVWLTTADKIKPQTLFSEIWQAMDERDTNFYRIG